MSEVQPRGRSVPDYVKDARAFLDANADKNAAAKLERTAFQSCMRAVAKKGIEKFEFKHGEGKSRRDYLGTYLPEEKVTVDARALYALFKEGEITEDQFLASISATQGAIKSACGTNILAKVSETEKTEPKLKIVEVK